MNDRMKDLFLEGCAIGCSNTAKLLKLAADRADAAAAYCKAKQTGTFSLGIKLKLGDHEFGLGNV
jgi:hypothetical protein